MFHLRYERILICVWISDPEKLNKNLPIHINSRSCRSKSLPLLFGLHWSGVGWDLKRNFCKRFFIVQEDDAAVVWGRLQSHHPHLQPHQSGLVSEDTRVGVLGVVGKERSWLTFIKFAAKSVLFFCLVGFFWALGCGWVLCFHGYQRGAVRVQGSRPPSSSGTCWSTWRRTAHQNWTSGSSGSKSTTCQRPGKAARRDERFDPQQGFYCKTMLWSKAGQKRSSRSVFRVYLVASTPGRYVGADMERWGHLRLRKVETVLPFFCYIPLTSSHTPPYCDLVYLSLSCHIVSPNEPLVSSVLLLFPPPLAAVWSHKSNSRRGTVACDWPVLQHRVHGDG